MSHARGIVVMGVSGSGKSRIGAALAARLGLAWIDGDDLHSAEAVAKMKAGTPLDDADRAPWLDRIGARLVETAGGSGAVVACSALKRAYRDRLRSAAPGVRFVYLSGAASLVGERLAARSGHYMPPTLLRSQFDALEAPAADERDVCTVPIDAAPDAVVERAVACLRAPPSYNPPTGR